jgi:hypothetical protein
MHASKDSMWLVEEKIFWIGMGSEQGPYGFHWPPHALGPDGCPCRCLGCWRVGLLRRGDHWATLPDHLIWGRLASNDRLAKRDWILFKAGWYTAVATIGCDLLGCSVAPLWPLSSPQAVFPRSSGIENLDLTQNGAEPKVTLVVDLPNCSDDSTSWTNIAVLALSRRRRRHCVPRHAWRFYKIYLFHLIKLLWFLSSSIVWHAKLFNGCKTFHKTHWDWPWTSPLQPGPRSPIRMQTIVGDPSAFLAAGDEYHSLVPGVSTPSVLNYKSFQES